MEKFKISYIGKSIFWLSFILGNICLFGYIFSGNSDFAMAGYFLLVFGTIINLIAFVGLLLFGFFNSKHSSEATNSAMILLINIPIAIIYFIIGTSILK